MSVRSVATCHCGAVRISFEMVDGLASLTKCDCSLCRRKNSGAVTAMTDDLVVEKGETLALYQFGTKAARHWFCSVCGIHTHHQRRSNPAEMGVHAGCVEGLDPRISDRAAWTDGVNHPGDVEA